MLARHNLHLSTRLAVLSVVADCDSRTNYHSWANVLHPGSPPPFSISLLVLALAYTTELAISIHVSIVYDDDPGVFIGSRKVRGAMLWPRVENHLGWNQLDGSISVGERMPQNFSFADLCG